MSQEIHIEELVHRPVMLSRDGELWTYLDPEFRARLEAFLQRYEAIRATETPPTAAIADYPMLPFGKHTHDAFEWSFRQHSLRETQRLLRDLDHPLTLEIGPWNGWLSNRLVDMGCRTIAVDYFGDDVNGLRAQRRYNNCWTGLQMNIADLDFRERSFDVAIVNHCLQFTSDPEAYIKRLQSLVSPGGLLILLGLTLYRNPANKRAAVAAFRQRYLDRHDFDIFFAPTRGYLDFNDRQMLLGQGIALHPYIGLWTRNVLAMLQPSKPWYGYGVWRAP